MGVQAVISGNPRNNNGATILWGGAAAVGDKVAAPDIAITSSRFQGGTAGPKVVTNQTQKVISAGTFAGNNAGVYTMRMVSTTIAGGQANTALLSGAAGYVGARTIHRHEKRRSYHITSWNYVTGAATKGADTHDDFLTDDASRPTRAIPGELAYTEHGMANSGTLSLPTLADYDVRTQG